MHKMKIAALALACATFACGEMTNEGLRSGQIHDLDSFALMATPPVNATLFSSATITGTVTLAPRRVGDRVFVRDGEVWSIAQYSEDVGGTRQWFIEFSRTENGNRVVVASDDGKTFLGGACFPQIIDIAPHSSGALWLLCKQGLIEFDLQTQTELRRIPVPSSPRSLAVQGARAYVGTGSNTQDPLGYELYEVSLSDGSVLDSLGQDVRDATGQLENRHIDDLAVLDGELVVRLSWETNEALLFDLSNNQLTSYLSGAPVHQLGTDPGDGTAYGYRSGDFTHYSSFELDQAIRSPMVQGTHGLSSTGRAMSVDPSGRLWVLYADASSTALIAYDPSNLQPVDGFVVDPAAASTILDTTGGPYGGIAPVGLAITPDAFYITASSVEVRLSHQGSALAVLDFTTGQPLQNLRLTQHATALCAQGARLYAYDELDPMSAGMFPSAPKAIELDTTTFATLRTLTTSKEVSGTGKMLCAPDALALSKSDARTWQILTTSNPPLVRDPYAFSVRSAGFTGVEVGGSLWMLDPISNSIIKTNPMLEP